MASEWLFVYGTLRKDYGLKLMQELTTCILYTGSAKVNARLYDLGSYPGAVKGERTEEVSGDLYEIAEPANVFPVLDEYEGEEFSRAEEDVTTATGVIIRAWVYWYTGKTDEALLIGENDYLNYLKNKKDRFV